MPIIKTSLELVLEYRCCTLFMAVIVIDRGVPKPFGVLCTETYCNKAMIAQVCNNTLATSILHPVIYKIRDFNMFKSSTAPMAATMYWAGKVTIK